MQRITGEEEEIVTATYYCLVNLIMCSCFEEIHHRMPPFLPIENTKVKSCRKSPLTR
jgi:hypothetical protein